MTPHETVPTRVQPGATWIGFGIPTTAVGVMLLFVWGVERLAADTLTSPVALAWFGWILVLTGSACLGTGAFYLAQHADRAAGHRVRVWWAPQSPTVDADDEV